MTTFERGDIVATEYGIGMVHSLDSHGYVIRVNVKGVVHGVDLTQVRRVVTLDPEGDGPDMMVELVESYRRTYNRLTGHDAISHDSMRIWHKVLTEHAKPTPPRPKEPGLWGVVKASYGTGIYTHDWVRYPDGWRTASGLLARWDELINPIVVRGGEGDD